MSEEAQAGRLVALTGGIGTGKSTVLSMFRAFGTPVVDADAVVRDLQRRAADRAFDRSLYPDVGAALRSACADALRDAAPFAVLDLPLFFEGMRAGHVSRDAFAAVVVVSAPEALQIERQQRRDGRTREEALRMIRMQIPLGEKCALADHVIDNSGPLPETERQVRALHARLLRDCGPTPHGGVRV